MSAGEAFHYHFRLNLFLFLAHSDRWFGRVVTYLRRVQSLVDQIRGSQAGQDLGKPGSASRIESRQGRG